MKIFIFQVLLTLRLQIEYFLHLNMIAHFTFLPHAEDMTVLLDFFFFDLILRIIKTRFHFNEIY